MDYVAWFICIFSTLMIIAGVVYLSLKVSEHYTMRKKRIEACKKLNLQDVYEEQIVELVHRTYVLYYSYAIQNIIAILCDLCGLVFSVATFIMAPESQSGKLIALLAVIFVVIVIFVKPHRRSSQYLKAWREMDYLTVEALQKLAGVTSVSPERVEEIAKILKYVAERRAKIERSISADEE